MTVNFKSIADLSTDIRANLHKIPSNVSVVVGVPRSGMLLASMLALLLNVPLVDWEGFQNGRKLGGGNTRRREEPADGVALIVDDSSSTGAAMREVASILQARPALAANSVTLVGYGTSFAMPNIDIVLAVVPLPRVFEWNVFHHPIVETACFDIDGVLCLDPTGDENDDGAKYINFLTTARHQILPTYTVGALVTSRLEKYRSQTEAWLFAKGIKYKELIMLDLPSAEERRRLGCHGSFKAEIYKKRPEILFVESELKQAIEIAEASGKPVLSIEGMTLVQGSKSVRALVWNAKRNVANNGLVRRILGPKGRLIAKKLVNSL